MDIKATNGPGFLSRAWTANGLLKARCAILLLFSLAGATQAQTNVTLAWDPSPDQTVLGYRVYWGGASRDYSQVVDVGTATSATISNLASGMTCYIAVTAYDGFGQESGFSDELTYMPVVLEVPRVQIRILQPGQVVLAGASELGRIYEIQVTETLTSWTVIGTVTAGLDGVLEFTDPEAGSRPVRFYRWRELP